MVYNSGGSRGGRWTKATPQGSLLLVNFSHFRAKNFVPGPWTSAEKLSEAAQ